MAGGLLGNIIGNAGLIRKGAELLGFNMPGWADTAIKAGSAVFGGRDAGSDGGVGSKGRYERAVDLGASTMLAESMVGVGEQKASTAVEYEDELREMLSAIRLYAEAE